MLADKCSYLYNETRDLEKEGPDNKSLDIVCHGHSIPCGYMAGNITMPFAAYPHILHQKLAERFPHSVINIIVTAKGGENSLEGSLRFKEDVLCHRPGIITLDYGRNDMFLEKTQIEYSWRQMIEYALKAKCKILLITPAPDCGSIYYETGTKKTDDEAIAEIIRELAEYYEVGLADVKMAFDLKFDAGHYRSEYLASVNHPNKTGHEIIAGCLMEWFPFICM